MANKLENLLNFNDFEKNWKAKEQKSTKHTEVGLDIVNENLYMKVMDKEASGWKDNVGKFIMSIKKNIKDNQVKDIKVTEDTVTFTIRGRKHKINKEDGSLTLYRTKAESFRPNLPPDEAGRVRQQKKRTKIRSEIEVNIPIEKKDAEAIHRVLKRVSEEND